MTAKEWAAELDRRLDAEGLTLQEDGLAVAEALIQEAVAEERYVTAQMLDHMARNAFQAGVVDAALWLDKASAHLRTGR